MLVDQAIYTSLERRGKAGYHLVSRSAGVSEAEATSLARWCPSHGGLAVDASNRSSVNFHPLSSGRFALSRTIAGRPEFSGRGGRQVYTHVLLLDIETLKRSGFRPFLIYRGALALGHFHYRPDPEPTLPRAELLSSFPKRLNEAHAATSRALGVPMTDAILTQLNAGQAVVLTHAGDRIAVAESILGQLEPEIVLSTSVATSLNPSSVRPFVLHVVPPAGSAVVAPGNGVPAARADL